MEHDKTGAKNKISHTLSIDGIQSSDASTVQWSIEVSKNDFTHPSGKSLLILIVVILY